jgi:hypothetical protein
MLFNGILNVVDIELDKPEGTEHIEMALLAGITVPVGNGQMGIIPAGKLRVPLTDRDQVEKLADKLKEMAETLPRQSNIETASSMSEVEAAAERLERIKQGGPQRPNS